MGTEMMIHKAEGKLNRTGFGNTVGVACMVCAAAAYVWIRSFTLSVQAAPAALTSPDATVYEQTDEGSSQVGNLVEGSTFEYLGDVTAEDGSVWHQVTTAGGVNGYIRGDKEIEITAEEEAASEEQGGQEASTGENAGEPAGNMPADGGENAGENTGEMPGENGGGEERTEEGAGEELEEGIGEELEEDNAAAVINMQNNREKSYVLDPSGKIKERETAAGPDSGIQNGSRMKAGIDMPLILGILVIVFCAGTIRICLGKIRQLKCGGDSSGMTDVGRNRVHRKIEKKKRRKAKKAAQSRKEGTKIPREKSGSV